MPPGRGGLRGTLVSGKKERAKMLEICFKGGGLPSSSCLMKVRASRLLSTPGLVPQFTVSSTLNVHGTGFFSSRGLTPQIQKRCFSIGTPQIQKVPTGHMKACVTNRVSSQGLVPQFQKRSFSGKPDPESEHDKLKALQEEMERAHLEKVKQKALHWFNKESWGGFLFNIGSISTYMSVARIFEDDIRYKHIADGIRLMGRGFKLVLYTIAFYFAAVVKLKLDELILGSAQATTDREAIIAEIKNGNQRIAEKLAELQGYIIESIHKTGKVEAKQHQIRDLENDVLILKAHLGAPKLELIESIKDKVTLITELEREVTELKESHEMYKQELSDKVKEKDQQLSDLRSDVLKLERDLEAHKQKLSNELNAKEQELCELKNELIQLNVDCESCKKELKEKQEQLYELECRLREKEQQLYDLECLKADDGTAKQQDP